MNKLKINKTKIINVKKKLLNRKGREILLTSTSGYAMSLYIDSVVESMKNAPSNVKFFGGPLLSDGLVIEH